MLMPFHNPNAWQNGYDAWQNGYDDAMYDGVDTSSEMPCKCEACLKSYDEGQQEAIKEIFGRGQSVQQSAPNIYGTDSDLDDDEQTMDLSMRKGVEP